MARLLIVAETDGPREIQLQPGVNRLGRIIEDNHFQVPDTSVSSHHCEVECHNEVVTVRDLGSTNGTFLNDEPIQEATLLPGQRLRLGTVEMVFESQAAPPVAPPPPRVVARVTGRTAEPSGVKAAGAMTAVADACQNHPNVPALWRCVKCGMLTCKACVKTTHAGMRDFRSCPACGSACLSMAEYKRMAVEANVGFFQLMPGAFGYPLKKDGLILLIVGSVLFGTVNGIHELLSKVPMMGGSIGLAYFLSMVMGTGYLFAAMQGIIVSSSDNEEAMPDWPEITNFWDSILLPFIRFVLIWAVCVGPGVLLMLLSPFLGVPIILLGVACLPMTILTVSMADGLSGLNPIYIFSGIGKMPGPYVVTCLVFLVVGAGVGGLQLAASLSVVTKLVLLFPITFVSLYGVAVEMRLLGLMYFANKRKLAWYR